ncbi:hypothetical protein WA026_011613 [Henosepilachna vigintioctopunctata]|uniref:ERCC4 domain-containing protein n=1 Tax=Henosepilachna vigintioctopunctata TaxID=420089 RepID=A0AAW1TJU7_9CUCU
MDLDIPDTSSDTDSNDDTILYTDYNSKDDVSCPSTTESELDSLFKKYLGDDFYKKHVSKEQTSDIVSESKEECTNFDLPKLTECASSKIIENGPTSSTSVDNKMLQYELDSMSDTDLPCFSQTKRRKKTDTHEEENLIIKLSSSSEDSEYLNKKQKQLKKEEERKNKAVKDALASHFKNLKPENCLKFIKVHIDEEIKAKDYSEDIVNELQNNNVSFAVKNHLTKSSISWTRQINSHILDTNGELIDTSKCSKIDEVLIVMESIDFLNHVHNQTFTTCIESLRTNLMENKIIFVIFGLERYYRFQKNKRNQNFAKEVSGKTRNVTDQKLFENVPTVSRRTVEYALTEIQLLYSISHRMLETKKELALFVFQLTKSIAQLPYKLQKQEKFMQSKWFMSENNKNCIAVDKNGNGLARLWKQIITTFPMTSLETAEALCAVYPTPLSLLKAYENVESTIEGEKLLQDIPIRRTAGPIGTTRKIGPELSKKFYHLFTSLDPDKVL